MPIPRAPKDATATASPSHPALLEMGAPLRVDLGDATALVTATGPVQATQYDGGAHRPTRTAGTFTIAIRPSAGTVSMSASDLSSRDETGTPVDLRPTGPASVRATATRPAKLLVRGTYGSGAAQLTWRRHGKVLAIWDFNIELD